jgi:hypothetical protein
MNRFKEIFTNKKVITGIIAAVVILSVGGTTVYFKAGRHDNSQQTAVAAESKNTQETQSATKNQNQEATTATDIMAVTLKDADGNDVVVEGVAVTDESGNTTITVKDENGNELVISGKTVTGDDGKKTVQEATVVSGDTITTSDGQTVDVSGLQVADVEDNNDGSIVTDVAVSEETKAEVGNKQEEAKEESGQEEAAQPSASDSQNSSVQVAEETNNTNGTGNTETDTSSEQTEPETQAPAEVVDTTPYKLDMGNIDCYQYQDFQGNMIMSNEDYAALCDIGERFAAGLISQSQAENEIWGLSRTDFDVYKAHARSQSIAGKCSVSDFASKRYYILATSDMLDECLDDSYYTVEYYYPENDTTIAYYVGVSANIPR